MKLFYAFFVCAVFSSVAYAATMGFGFISSSRVNLRKGPGKMYRFDVVVTSPGMPVEILGRKDDWSLARLPDGKRGWVLSSAISHKARRGMTVLPETSLYRMPIDDPYRREKIALLEKNVSFLLLECGVQWCRVGVNKRLTGWIKKDQIWGVYPEEEF